MLQIKPITTEFSVSPQISLEDVSTIAKLGYKTIINNRPDDEEPSQPSNQQLQEKCQQLGLNYQYLPAISGQVTKQNSQDMQACINKMEKPILAFCRTGTRSCILWLGTAKNNIALNEGIERVNTQGYAINIAQVPSLNE